MGDRIKFIKLMPHDPNSVNVKGIDQNYLLAHYEYEKIVNFILNSPNTFKSYLVQLIFLLFVQFYLELIICGKITDAQKFWKTHSHFFIEKGEGYEDTLNELKKFRTVADISNHSLLSFFRIDKCVIEMSEDCKNYFIQYIKDCNLSWTSYIIDSFFILNNGDLDNCQKTKLVNLQTSVNELPHVLPSFSVYYLGGCDISKIRNVNLSHNRLMVASAFTNSIIQLWQSSDQLPVEGNDDVSDTRLTTRPVILSGHKGSVNNVKFHYLDSLLFSCSNDKTVRAWTLEDKFETTAIYKGLKNEVRDIDFNGDKVHFVSCSNDTVCLYNIIRTTPVSTFTNRTLDITSIKYPPNQDYFATISKDKSVYLWNMQSEHPIKDRILGSETIYCVEFSPQWNYIATAGEGNKIKIWNLLNTSSPIKELHCDIDHIYSLSYNKNGRILAAVGSEKICFYDLHASNIDTSVNSTECKEFMGSFHVPNSNFQYGDFDHSKSNLFSTIVTRITDSK